jgi:hypothetical protein
MNDVPDAISEALDASMEAFEKAKVKEWANQ